MTRCHYQPDREVDCRENQGLYIYMNISNLKSLKDNKIDKFLGPLTMESTNREDSKY